MTTTPKSLKQAAWRYGVAKAGSEEERIARVQLVAMLTSPAPSTEETCATCGFVGQRAAHRYRHVFTPAGGGA